MPQMQPNQMAFATWKWKKIEELLFRLLLNTQHSLSQKSQFSITLQQNVFLVTKISEEIFFVAQNTALVTKYEFRH